MAALTRQKKLPALETLMPERSASRGVSDPALIRESLLDWAARVGAKVERHATPVI